MRLNLCDVSSTRRSELSIRDYRLVRTYSWFV